MPCARVTFSFFPRRTSVLAERANCNRSSNAKKDLTGKHSSNSHNHKLKYNSSIEPTECTPSYFNLIIMVCLCRHCLLLRRCFGERPPTFLRQNNNKVIVNLYHYTTKRIWIMNGISKTTAPTTITNCTERLKPLLLTSGHRFVAGLHTGWLQLGFAASRETISGQVVSARAMEMCQPNWQRFGTRLFPDQG